MSDKTWNLPSFLKETLKHPLFHKELGMKRVGPPKSKLVLVLGPNGAFAASVGEMISSRDKKIFELEEKFSDLKFKMDSSLTGWCLPRQVEPSDLPVPRLELRIEKIDNYNWAWVYMLVYSHYADGHLEGVVISQTRTTGSTPPMAGDRLAIPFRDGVHIRYDARSLNLPAFVTYEARAEPIEPMLEASWRARRTELLKR